MNVDSNARLREIAGSSVQARWNYNSNHQSIDLALPHGNTFGIDVEGELGTPAATFYARTLRVNSELRNHGIGKRLVSGLAHLALKYQVPIINGTVESQHTVKIFRTLFGDERIEYLDGGQIPWDPVPIPLDSEQAWQSLQRAEAFERDPEYRGIGFSFSIDVSGLKRSEFEPPIEIDRPTSIR